MQAAAAEEGRAVNDVVSERWGSLTALTSTLTDRRAAHGASLACMRTVLIDGWLMAVHEVNRIMP